MKRFLSILLACTMLLSMVTISHAADETEVVTVEYWNADSTKITIDLSKEVDADALKNAITLKEGGKAIDFTVTKREKTVDSTIPSSVDGKFNISGMILTTETTYEIAPANGLNFTDLYTIAVGSAITGSDVWTKNFKVKKLWSEDFNNYTSSFPWKIEGGGNNVNLTLENDGNGDNALAWSHSGGIYRVTIDSASEVNFADTEVPASTYWANNSQARKETEYNLEMDMRFNTAFTDAKYGFGFKIAMHNGKHDQMLYNGSGITAGVIGNSAGFDMLAGTWGYAEYTYNASVSYSANAANTSKSNWYENFVKGATYDTSLSWANSLISKSSLSDGNWANDTFHDVSISVKDNNLKFSIDEGFENYDFGAHQGNSTNWNGLVAFYGNGNYGGANTYFVDNIIATKAVEVVVGTLDSPTNFVAGSEGIQFKLAKDMDAVSLKNGISILADGSPVNDFTLTKGEDNTYVIVPDGGIDADATYTVTLAAGLYNETAGGVSTLAVPFSTEVGIEKIPFNAPTYWNADTTKITLDIDAPIDAAVLKDGITLYKGTEEVEDFTVTALTNAGTLEGVYTYTIAPADGIKEGTIYTVALRAGTYNSDGFFYSLATSYSKSFKVDVLVRDTMDYKNDTETYGAIPWNEGCLSGDAMDADISIEAVNGNNALKVVTNGAKAWIAPYEGYQDAAYQEFANTGMMGWAYSYSKNHPASKEENYSLEAKVKVAAEGNYSLQFYQNSARHTEYQVWMNSLRAQNSKIGGRLRNGGTGDYASWSGNATPGLNSDTYKNVTVVSKGTDYKFFAGDAYLHQTSDIEMVDVGIPVIYLDNGANATNTWYFDDVIISKATEVTSGLVYGDLIVTIDGNQIPDLIGAETISASINVMNLDDVLPCKVVLAVYDSSNKSLKNAVVSDILEIGKGITPFVFNNVALNGGDIIEVFFWDGFEKLTPYRAPASFPAEE